MASGWSRFENYALFVFFFSIFAMILFERRRPCHFFMPRVHEKYSRMQEWNSRETSNDYHQEGDWFVWKKELSELSVKFWLSPKEISTHPRTITLSMACHCKSCQKIVDPYPTKWIRFQICVSHRYRCFCIFQPVEAQIGHKTHTNDHWKKNLLINMTRFNLRKKKRNRLAIELTRRYIIAGLSTVIGSVFE